MTSPASVADTIAAQIGNRALFMIGAKNLCGSADALSFKVGRNDKRVTHIRIRLTPADVYTVEFLNCRGFNLTVIDTRENVYADSLLAVIETGTGLRTSL